jgi:hypothetical protein
MKHTFRASLTLITVLTALGCSPSVGEQGCRDFVTTIGDVAARCGFDRATNERAAENAATANRGCGAVVSLRDEAAFYDSCLPYIEGLTCAQFNDSSTTFPASCGMQLEIR